MTLARFVCHFLVERMPDQGLPELCHAMADYFDFYTEGPNARLAIA